MFCSFDRWDKKQRRNLFLKNYNLHPYCVPQLEKIVLNVNIDQDSFAFKRLLGYAFALECISKQKASLLRSRQSIAQFQIRKGDSSGFQVTLRKQNMVDFLETYIHLIFPRLHEGIWKKKGNILFSKKKEKKLLSTPLSLNKPKKFTCSFGCSEVFLFPELEQQRQLLSLVSGFNVSVVVDGSDKRLVLPFLTSMLIPFQ